MEKRSMQTREVRDPDGNTEKDMTSVHTGGIITEPRAPCSAEPGACARIKENQRGPGVAI